MVFEILKKTCWFEKILTKRCFDKVLMFYKVWWKVFGVVESEFINGFSKFWKKFGGPEKALRKRYI